MILRHARRYPESMVQLRGIYPIHPAELLPENSWFVPENGRTMTRLRPDNQISPKSVSAEIGVYIVHKADRAETWGDLFGPALPVIRPGHFMSFTNREARSGKQYIGIYIYIYCRRWGEYQKCTCVPGTQFPVKYLPGKNVPWLYKIYTNQKMPLCDRHII